MNKQIALQRTRMYAALRESHPLYFGDPLEFHRSQLSGFSGPAYEQRNGGGAGLIGAVLAVATGGASLGFTTLASTLSTISLVSSVVGAVTGNKTFSTIGALAGLGGAFMNLSSAGTFGDGLKSWAADTNTSIMGSGAAQAGAPVSDAIVNNVSSAGAQGADTVTQAVQNGTGINSLGDANLQNASGVTAPTDAGTGLIDVGSSVPTNPLASTNGVTDPLAANVEGAGGAAATSSTPVASSSNSALNIAKAGEPVNAMADAASKGGNLAQVKAASAGIDTGTSLFDKISKFATDNKALTEIALKGVQGMYQSPQDKALKEAQINSSNSMAGLYDAKTAEIQGQAANANAIGNVGGMKVNTGAQLYNPKPAVAAGVRPAGLIQTRSV